jgi:hypothetical protein
MKLGQKGHTILVNMLEAEKKARGNILGLMVRHMKVNG